MFYTEILTQKVEFLICSLVSLMKKDHKTTFLVRFSQELSKTRWIDPMTIELRPIE